MKMHLLLGVKRPYETDGQRLLVHILHRYGVFADVYRFDYCYSSEPDSTVKGRANALALARRRLEETWIQTPGPTIGLGWMACELMLGKGKTKLKHYVGTRWHYIGGIERTVWICNDPAAGLFDPNLVVDIAAVIVAAGKEAGLPMRVNKEEAAFDWSKWL